MSETIVIFRKDGTGDCFALFPELPGDDTGFSARRINGSVNIAPPTMTAASPTATLPPLPSTPTCSRNWSEGDTSCRFVSRATPDMHERRRRIGGGMAWPGNKLASASR